MPSSEDALISIFEKIEDAYRPERDSFSHASYSEFIKDYDSFIGEFNWEEIKTTCSQSAENKAKPFLLVAGDLSGIQDTVYTISSKGALKSLRARSFMLEVLCEHCCYELLTGLLGNGSGYKQLRKHVVGDRHASPLRGFCDKYVRLHRRNCQNSHPRSRLAAGV